MRLKENVWQFISLGLQSRTNCMNINLCHAFYSVLTGFWGRWLSEVRDSVLHLPVCVSHIVTESNLSHSRNFLLAWSCKGKVPIISNEFTSGSRGGPRGPGPPDPRFWGPKIELFRPSFNFSVFFLASLRSAYFFHSYLTIFHNFKFKIFLASLHSAYNFFN